MIPEEEAREYIEWRTSLRPTVAVVLGSGLGAFADELEERVEIAYSDIPSWPRSAAQGHAGKLVIGKLGGLEAAVMAGRVHLYEGWTPQQVTFGVRVLGALGVRGMVFTNAAGGINLSLGRGGLMLISDHINLQGSNPLVGANDESLGPRFPDMSEAYSKSYREVAQAVAQDLCDTALRGCIRRHAGPELRDSGRDSLSAHDRRGRGGDVYGG